jgi:mRNA interferase MazF
MPTFSQYDVVSVPFPYTDRAALERRPALVISKPALERRFGLLWVLMITAAENAPWDDDVPLTDHRAAGLSIPSIIRPTKVATVEASRARFRGKVPSAVATRVAAVVKSTII